MNNLEKNAAKEALKNISYEMLEYANKDELANQVVRRGISDPGFLHFIALTMRAVTLMRTLEEAENDD